MVGLWGGNITCDTTEFPVYIEGSEKIVYTEIKELETEIILEGFDNEVREKLDKLMIKSNEVRKDETFIWKNILILVKKFLNIIERIDRIDQVSMTTTNENMGSEVLTINVNKCFSSIVNHFNQPGTRKKRAEITFNSFRSISRNNDYLDMKSVVGCSSVVEYTKRKNICIKRFLNMIKRPVINFIGSDLLFPLISLIDKPIQELSNNEIKQLMTILELDMSKNEFILLLREKLVNPGADYNEARQEIENRNMITDSTTTEKYEIEYQVQSDMPIENSLEGEKQARVESEEVLENERDIGILKGQLAELIGNIKGTVS